MPYCKKLKKQSFFDKLIQKKIIYLFQEWNRKSAIKIMNQITV